VATTTQCNPGVTGCKAFTAAYDKLGNLTSLVYPANSFTVTYGIDSAARLTSATDSNGVIYAQAPTYWANGAMKEFSSPNFNNNTYHVDLNNRLQPTEIWAGSAEGASALFDKKYIYGAATANNGNISTITNVLDSTRTQSFGYDALNRLLSAGDNGHWANTYVYDAWGNLTQKNPGSPAGENLVKASDTNNHLSGIAYDAAGNEVNDGLGKNFTFDAENRITVGAGVTNTYDADGRRIARSTGTNYWYAPGGAALAETDSSGVWTNYISFGGQRLARNVNGDIKYYITDHLHSTGMFVDKAGTTAAIQDDNDFYPWGGVVPGVGKTTSTNNIKFTGQYRDAESQLDYFGARYYSNINGRFMSPDWAAAPTTVPYAKFGDPQSLNLYSYVENGPVDRIDSDGHVLDDCSACDHGDSGFSVAGYAGSDIGLELCPTCEPGDPNPKQPQKQQQDQSGQSQDQTQDAGVKAPPAGAPPVPPPPGTGPNGEKNEWVKVDGTDDKTYGPVYKPKYPVPDTENGSQPKVHWDPKDGWWSHDKGGKEPRDHYDRWGNKVNMNDNTLLGNFTHALKNAGESVSNGVKEHPAATAMIVGTVALGAIILSGGSALPLMVVLALP
jgi:RHS repeat-associated protein